MMQHSAYGGRPPQNLSTQPHTGAFLALALFALAGLISGFAIGAFVHPHKARQTTSALHSITPVINTRMPSPSPTPLVQQPEKMGWPVLLQRPVFSEVADDASTYTISVQAVDQSIDAGHGAPIHASSISGRIWLTKDGHVSRNMPAARLRSVDTLAEPFPKEVSGSIDFFDPASHQTQLTNSAGRVTWNYKLPTSLKPGTYFLVVLTDWKGRYANWYWIEIRVTV
jgi:hypothetical protein